MWTASGTGRASGAAAERRAVSEGAHPDPFSVGLLLYPGLTQLDLTGPGPSRTRSTWLLVRVDPARCYHHRISSLARVVMTYCFRHMNRDFPDDSSQPPKTVARLCFDRKRDPTTRFGVLG